MVSDKLNKKLKIIKTEEFGIKLTDERTARLSNFLVDYFQTLLKVNENKPSSSP